MLANNLTKYPASVPLRSPLFLLSEVEIQFLWGQGALETRSSRPAAAVVLIKHSELILISRENAGGF